MNKEIEKELDDLFIEWYGNQCRAHVEVGLCSNPMISETSDEENISTVL